MAQTRQAHGFLALQRSLKIKNSFAKIIVRDLCWNNIKDAKSITLVFYWGKVMVI